MTYVGESNNNILLLEPSDSRELFTYNHKVRQNYISTFQRILPWQGMTANHEIAWLSLKDTLLHIIWAEDSWINYSIQGLEDPNRPFNYSRYQTWDSMKDYDSKVISKVDEYLYNIKQEDLDRKVWRINNDGIRRTSKVKDTCMLLLKRYITEEK